MSSDLTSTPSELPVGVSGGVVINGIPNGLKAEKPLSGDGIRESNSVNGPAVHNESNGIPNTGRVSDATGSTPGATTDESSNRIPLHDVPAYSIQRKLRVITIGAGFSGLVFAHKLRYEHPEMEDIVTNTIFEGRSDIGGTWLANSYPGVQCDVPSHIYAFPFDPNPDWDRFYSTGPTIHAYIKKIAAKWDLTRDVQLNTQVVGMYWEADAGRWKVVVEHGGVRRDEYADVVVSGQGILNTWSWPDIPGLQDAFQGHKVHSAAWDHGYEYAHKRIGVVGNGSSGIQILPQMAALPGTTVTSFQRGPTWVVARMDPGKLLGKPGIGVNPAYTDDDRRRFRDDPEALHQYRRHLIQGINKAFRMFVKGSAENLDATSHAAAQMATKLNHDPALCAKLIPTWELGCRRVTPGAGYLESFLRPNVHLTQSPITSVTADAILTADGTHHPVDVIVCATGFDVSHCPRYPVIGLDGLSLADKWADEPESYLSLACPGFPNYLTFMGPNAVVGHGSLVEGLNWSADYMVKWLKKLAAEDIKAFHPRQSVVDDFVRYGDRVHQTLTWTGACRSWYKKNRVDGRVTATFPGSALLYKRMIADIRGEDFHIEYRSRNRFRFMGNGFTEYELDDTNDLAWYIKN